jgi:cysteine desulfuration protein SufE
MTFEEKCHSLKDKFAHCTTQEEIYHQIMSLGKQLQDFPQEAKIEANIVNGCQSTVFLISSLDEGKVFFRAESDALISSGLAALLIDVYSGEAPEAILKTPPTYLKELNIPNSLSPNRSNGLGSIYLHMTKLALMHLVKK